MFMLAEVWLVGVVEEGKGCFGCVQVVGRVAALQVLRGFRQPKNQGTTRLHDQAQSR